MRIWRITCQIDDGCNIYQETSHVVAPNERDAASAILRYWESESNDTSATLVAIDEYLIQEGQTVIL